MLLFTKRAYSIRKEQARLVTYGRYAKASSSPERVYDRVAARRYGRNFDRRSISESHYFPHTNENSASQGRFSRFGEVAPPPRQVMPVCRSFFDKTSTAPSVLATLGHLPHTGAAKSLHTLSRHLFIKATAFPHVTSSLSTHESSGDITPVTSSLPPLGGSARGTSDDRGDREKISIGLFRLPQKEKSVRDRTNAFFASV